MKTWKLLFALFFAILIGQKAFAQSQEPERVAFLDRKDATKAIQLYPNPATDYLTLKLDAPQARKIKLTVFTIIGNTVDVDAEVVDEAEIRIKVRDLASGYYLLAIHNQETNTKNTFKFLKR